MAKQIINLGTGELTGDGESIRSALDKVNDNFDEVYPRVEALEDGNITSDVVGSVFGDDSTLLVDGVNSTIPYPANAGVVWDGNAPTTVDVALDRLAAYTQNSPSLTGDFTGSVFGDDSTVLVDGVNNKIVGPVLSSDLRSTSSNVRIGSDAGLTNQGTYSIAIGQRAGNSNQSADGIAIGYAAGRDDQQTDGIAIGQNAGQVNQGESSVAIGTMVGKTNQHANTIMLSATGFTFNSTQANAFFVKPIASAVGTTMLMYDAGTGEVTHNAAIPGYTNTADLKALVAASTDFADYQTRIAAL